MTAREYDCEGCGQLIVDIVGNPALPGLPDLCGGCMLVGPGPYVAMARCTEWMNEEEAAAADRALAAFRERWGEEMTEKGITHEAIAEARQTLAQTKPASSPARP